MTAAPRGPARPRQHVTGQHRRHRRPARRRVVVGAGAVQLAAEPLEASRSTPRTRPSWSSALAASGRSILGARRVRSSSRTSPVHGSSPLTPRTATCRRNRARSADRHQRPGQTRQRAIRTGDRQAEHHRHHRRELPPASPSTPPRRQRPTATDRRQRASCRHPAVDRRVPVPDCGLLRPSVRHRRRAMEDPVLGPSYLAAAHSTAGPTVRDAISASSNASSACDERPLGVDGGQVGRSGSGRMAALRCDWAGHGVPPATVVADRSAGDEQTRLRFEGTSTPLAGTCRDVLRSVKTSLYVTRYCRAQRTLAQHHHGGRAVHRHRGRSRGCRPEDGGPLDQQGPRAPPGASLDDSRAARSGRGIPMASGPRGRTHASRECFGFVKMYPHRGAVPTDFWRRPFEGARDCLDVLVYAGLFMPDRDPDMAQKLNQRAEAGVRIRFLLGDPKVTP